MKKESTHIRIDKDLKQHLQAMARPGETVNDVIRRLIAGTPAVTREVNITAAPVTSDVNNKLTDLYQRIVILETGSKMDSDYIDTLDEKVQTLEFRTKYLMQVAQKLHPLLEDAQSIPLPEDLEPDPYDDQDKEDNQDTEDEPAPVRKTKSTPGDWITVTEEIRSQMIARVSELQKTGMSYEKIGKLIGMGKGRFSEIHQGKMKKIRRVQYEALMRIS